MGAPQGVGGKGETLDVVSAFQSYGEFIGGHIDEEQRKAIVRASCPGAGACGGMYTANTMASAIEAMGMSLPGSSSTPAEDPGKQDECRRAGEAVRGLLERGIVPTDIMTREAFENAMVIVMVLGGSTNAVLHLIAMARAGFLGFFGAAGLGPATVEQALDELELGPIGKVHLEFGQRTWGPDAPVVIGAARNGRGAGARLNIVARPPIAAVREARLFSCRPHSTCRCCGHRGPARG